MPLITPKGSQFKARVKEIEAIEREHLEPEELQSLWKTIQDPFWRAYFRLQYHFGGRQSEIALILKEDVSYTEKKIVIRRLKKRSTEEGYVERVYNLTDKLIARMKPVDKFVPKDNPWFFGSRRMSDEDVKRVERMANIRITTGGFRSVSRSTAQKRFITFATDAGIPEHLRHTHVLRHTRATLLFAKGATENQVQMILDHSSPAITRRYIGWAKDLKKNASDLLEKLGNDDEGDDE